MTTPEKKMESKENDEEGKKRKRRGARNFGVGC